MKRKHKELPKRITVKDFAEAEVVGIIIFIIVFISLIVFN